MEREHKLPDKMQYSNSTHKVANNNEGWNAIKQALYLATELNIKTSELQKETTLEHILPYDLTRHKTWQKSRENRDVYKRNNDVVLV